MAGRPKSFKSVAQLQKGIDAYFAECEACNFTFHNKAGKKIKCSEPTSMSGLASSLGVDRFTLFTYGKGEYDSEGQSFSATVKKAKARIERNKVAMAALGIYDRVICIFDLKNNHGWKDRDSEQAGEGKPEPTRVEVTVQDARKPEEEGSKDGESE